MQALILILFLTFCTELHAQKIELLASGAKTSLRGMSVVNDNIIWVSGSNGTVGNSVDGGLTWKWQTVKGFEKRDFRDIEAFDKNTALIIAIAEPAEILKTTDGGLNWKIVFTDSSKGMFLDAMDFYNNKNGIVVGDPVEGKVFLAYTKNNGDDWVRFNGEKNHRRWVMNEDEAFFASSGTNIKYLKKGKYRLVSGGKSSRWFDENGDHALSVIQGKESTGANSIAVYKKQYAVVGGDFTNDKDTTRNCLITNDGGVNWASPAKAPRGYRSCVIYMNAGQLLTCGTSGVDISNDGGINWNLISPESFHVCQKAKKGNAVFLAGSNGKIAKLVL
ncbi:MAG: oxidoreductase [Chitinophagaceae bacterium]|nr:oxidoreductase [Chitinophagaceae bacterium]